MEGGVARGREGLGREGEKRGGGGGQTWSSWLM